jgi:hypothetical protein
MVDCRIFGECVDHRREVPVIECQIEPIDQVNYLKSVGSTDMSVG